MFQFLKTSPKHPNICCFFYNCTKHNDGIFILEKNVHEAIKKLADRLRPDLHSVFSVLEECNQDLSMLTSFLSWCRIMFGHVDNWPKEVMELFKAISRKSPTCAIIHNESHLMDLIQKVIEGFEIKKHPVEMKYLQDYCPLLFNLLTMLPSDYIPSEAVPLLKCLLIIAKSSFMKETFVQDPVTPSTNHAFFQNHLVIRGRGSYSLDTDNNKTERFCTKRYGRHPTLLPGIFPIQYRHGN